MNKTVRNIKKIFPDESESIEKFFSFLQTDDYFYLFGHLRNKLFVELLNEFFKDNKLKAALSILLGNIGLSAEKASALAGVALYREFILDGGYYPVGGNQGFADSLNKLFCTLGGKTLLSREAIKIVKNYNKVKGVILSNGEQIEARFVVSNIDAIYTFKKLLNCKKKDVISKLNKLKLSPSSFVVYLGLNVDLKKLLKNYCVTWKFSTYNINSCYSDTKNIIDDNILKYIVCSFPSLHDHTLAPRGKSIVELFLLAPFKNKKFWDLHKEKIAHKMIKKAEEVIPNLSRHIEVKEIATPYTFYRYTGNSRGAIYGWESSPSQIDKTIMPTETYVEGLYLAGHWTTNGFGQGGIASVSYAGRHAAEMILTKAKINLIKK